MPLILEPRPPLGMAQKGFRPILAGHQKSKMPRPEVPVVERRSASWIIRKAADSIHATLTSSANLPWGILASRLLPVAWNWKARTWLSRSRTYRGSIRRLWLRYHRSVQILREKDITNSTQDTCSLWLVKGRRRLDIGTIDSTVEVPDPCPWAGCSSGHWGSRPRCGSKSTWQDPSGLELLSK